MGTQATDSMTMGMQALAAMETHAAHLSSVAARLLTAHANHLPELLAVRAEASDRRTLLALQPRTADDARRWARALDVSLTVTLEDGGEDTLYERAAAEFSIEGVSVRLASCQMFTADQWAERIAPAVAA